MKKLLNNTWDRSSEMESLLLGVNLATENMMSSIKEGISKEIGKNHQPISSLNTRSSEIWTEPATFIKVNRNTLLEKLNGKAS